ncbi:hypothetical protein A2U01_0062487, partial [Trifolium medium]|nr:hypothetical protein [Trifolium medium]
MPMSVEFLSLIVSTVRSRVTWPEIAMLQKRRSLGMQHKGLDPPPKDVSTAWA